MRKLNTMRRLLKSWSLKHIKILTAFYTLIVLLAGVLIGGHYEGRDEDGTYYYHVMGVTIYGGIINNDKN